MSRFVFASWPFAGDLYPHIAVAQALRARGHTVAFYTGRDARDLLAAEGYEHFPFDAGLDGLLASKILTPNGMSISAARAWRFASDLRAVLVESMPFQISDLDGVCRSWKPDAIVCDASILAPMVILREARQVPVALLSTHPFCFLPGPDLPTPGVGGRRGRAWHRRLGARARTMAANLLLARTRRAINQLRRRHGLQALTRPVVTSMARLPLYLVPSCREFDYNRDDVPASVHYVGPCLWYPTQKDSSCVEALSADRPWVHVTEGTLHWQEPELLKAAVRGLADLAVDVVITTGERDPDSLGLGRVPPNIHVWRWASHSSLVRRCAAVVTTGGAGTIMAALSAGVPLVVVPTNWDKPENARRVADAGAGVRLSSYRCSPSRLRAAVTDVITNPAYRQNAQRLAACLGRAGGPETAAELLEQLAAGENRSTPATL
jgi:MGT family glycosyltransferase